MRTGRSPIVRGKLTISGARAARPAVKEALRVTLLPLLARLFYDGEGFVAPSALTLAPPADKEGKGK